MPRFCLAFFSSLMLWTPALALIEKNRYQISGSDQFRIIWSFKFASGGELDMDISLEETSTTQEPNNTIQMLICTENQLVPLRDLRFRDVCEPETFNATECKFQTQLGGGGIKHNFTDSVSLVADREDLYHLLQLNCVRKRFNVHTSLVAVNPGGEYLSLSEVPYKPLYVAVSILWSVLLVMWCYNWWRYRKFNVKLQRFMTVVPFTQIVSAVVLLHYWREKSVTGIEPDLLYWLYFVTVGIARGAFYVTLIYIAKGWSVTRAELTKSELRYIWSMVFFLVVSYWIYIKWKGFLLFFLVIMYVMILRYIFAAIVDNSQALVVQLQLIRRIDVDATSTPVYTKFHMFKLFQGAMVVYISVDVIFHLWATIFLRQTPWIEDMMENVIALLMSFGVGYTFRLRPFNPYFYQIIPIHSVNGQGDSSPLIRGSSIEEANIRPGGQQWKPGMALPEIPQDYTPWLRGQEMPLIIVENPPTYDPEGNSVENVAVAQPTYGERNSTSLNSGGFSAEK